MVDIDAAITAEAKMSCERYGPLGGMGYEIGEYSLALLKNLEGSKIGTEFPANAAEGWDEDDLDAFRTMYEIESGIPLTTPSGEMDGGDLADLHRTFRQFRVAMPFTDAELGWMFVRPVKDKGESYRDSAEVIAPAELHLISAGLRQVVQGRDLVRRWWAWRRDLHEFAGQGGREEACRALGIMAREVLPPAHWPRNHQDMRARLLGD